MSAPVLSRPPSARGRAPPAPRGVGRASRRPPRGLLARGSPPSLAGRGGPPGRGFPPAPADLRARPSEPILFPRLRIRFADFPYLRPPIGQRLLTSETRCGYRYDRARWRSAPSGFQGPAGAPRTPRKPGRSAGGAALPPVDPIPGSRPPSRRRENPPRDPRRRPRVRPRRRLPPASRFGDLDPIPFRGRRGPGARWEVAPPPGRPRAVRCRFPPPLRID